MKTVVLNGEVINYDGNIDYSKIADEVIVYENTPEDLILERVQGCEVVVTKEMPVREHIIKQFPESVKLIVEAGTGYNNIDLEAVKEKEILLCNIPAYSSKRVAHITIMMILGLSCMIQKQLKMIDEGNDANFTDHLMVDYHEVNEKTLGIIGYGNISREVIKVANALGMKVVCYTRTKREDLPGVHFTSLEEVLSQSDYVSLHCPLNDVTRHLIGKRELAMMKSTAFIINTARGALIDEKALIEALDNHQIAGAGLDVQECEPINVSHPLFGKENVILTPHIGWRGLETRRRLVDLIQKDIESYANGQPINVVVDHLRNKA